MRAASWLRGIGLLAVVLGLSLFVLASEPLELTELNATVYLAFILFGVIAILLGIRKQGGTPLASVASKGLGAIQTGAALLLLSVVIVFFIPIFPNSSPFGGYSGTSFILNVPFTGYYSAGLYIFKWGALLITNAATPSYLIIWPFSAAPWLNLGLIFFPLIFLLMSSDLIHVGFKLKSMVSMAERRKSSLRRSSSFPEHR